ncbi:MAG: M20 family metallopeptidase [Acidimicrobiales bacterium]|nr:M20 family metallopeptidase [Acidimicrobiales bacterium]
MLCSLLDGGGLEVERHAYGLETAFAARAGTRGPLVAVLCEYDALPGVGHACGHNVIGAAGVGAALALAGLADRLGGRLLVLGTPAEEGGGGKVQLLRAGAFDGVDVAMMVHPADAELTAMTSVAITQLEADYHGRAAHAAAFPHLGRNALDAAVLGYVNVAALRQHIRPDERVHGVFVAGGERPNIVPAHASTSWYVRSPTLASLAELQPRVVACLQAGAEAAGCRLVCREVNETYAEVRDNRALQQLWAANGALVGRSPVDPTPSQQVVGSTDMGNVSQVVPSIHPMIQVAPAGVPIHSEEFARWAASPEGDRAVIDGAILLAATAVDVWDRSDVLDAVRAGFEAPVPGPSDAGR